MSSAYLSQLPVEDHGPEFNGGLRVLFTCNNIPSHLDSLLFVIRAAERAGHTVAVAAPEELGAHIASRGLEQVLAGREWIKRWAKPGSVTPLWLARSSQPFYLARMAGKPAVHSARDIIAAGWKPDLIVRECMEFGAVLAAEVLGVPSACIGTASYVPMAFAPHRMAKIFAPSRRALGLPKDPKGVSAYPFYASLMPEEFDPQAALMPNVHFYHDDSLTINDEQPPKWLAEIPTDRPLIYACLGSEALSYSGMLRHATRMMKAMLAALSKLDDYAVVVSTGNSVDPEHFGDLPEHIRVLNYVPQRQVLARANLFITHAGYKSFMESVIAGVPMVTIPLIGDSLYTAQRAAESGVARNVLGKQVNASGILDACTKVLSSSSYKQRVVELRSQILALPGSGALIEDLTGLVNR